MILSYHGEIEAARAAYDDLMPHLDSRGQEKVKRAVSELDEMQSYLNPKFKRMTTIQVNKLRKKTSKKLHDLLGFLQETNG